MPIKLSKQWFTQTFTPIVLVFIITLSMALSVVVGFSSLFVTASAASPSIQSFLRTRTAANTYNITIQVADPTITTDTPDSSAGISAFIDTKGLSYVKGVVGSFDVATKTYPVTFTNVIVTYDFDYAQPILVSFSHEKPHPLPSDEKIGFPPNGKIFYESSASSTPPPTGDAGVNSNVLKYIVGSTTIRYGQSFSVGITIKTDSPIPSGAQVSLKNDAFISTGTGTITPVKDQTNVYVVNFSQVQYLGKGRTLNFSLAYNDYSTPIKNYSVVINECVEGEPTSSVPPSDSSSSSSSSTSIEPAKPYILINNYTYGGKQVTAGKNFTLNTSFYNTSTGINLENIIVEITSSADILLQGSTNKHFLPSLGASESMKKDFSFTVKPTAETTTQNITIKFTYDYFVKGERKAGESSEIIPIPISQTNSFKAFIAELPEDLIVDEEGTLTMTYLNSGRSTLYNLTAEIKGDIQKPVQLKYIGNIESGKTANHDFDITVSKEGETPVEVIYNYEDVNGIKKELVVPCTITATPVADMPTFDSNMGMGMVDGAIGADNMVLGSAPQEAPTLPIVAIIVIAIVVIIVIVVIIKIIKKRKERMLDDDI